MSIAVLFPRYEHQAIEERYASWQTRLRLHHSEGCSRLIPYESSSRASEILKDVTEEYVLVVTDPLLIPSSRIGVRLLAALDDPDARAAVPVSNESEEPRQRRPPPVPYLTLPELEEAFDVAAGSSSPVERIVWGEHDPGAFVCRTEGIAALDVPLRSALRGFMVGIVPGEYVHRWPTMRGQARLDLLERVSSDARTILEFGCGEAQLGAALKERQACRVVGIELDPEAVEVARQRIDAIHCGDVRTILPTLDERFDWIVGSEIVEHLDDPWAVLESLRRLAAPGGRLLLSIPNVANASLISDLMRGRFDYVYMGLTCVGHLRFFTRRTISDMLTMAGWSQVEFEPQEAVATPARDRLLSALAASGIEHSPEDLLPTGYYVTARNGPGTTRQSDKAT